jgi:hypothetical protein
MIVILAYITLAAAIAYYGALTWRPIVAAALTRNPMTPADLPPQAYCWLVGCFSAAIVVLLMDITAAPMAAAFVLCGALGAQLLAVPGRRGWHAVNARAVAI